MLVNLRNKTRSTHSIMVGAGYLVEPFKELVLPRDEADLAMRRYPDILEQVDVGTIGNAIALDKDAPIWIANMSGDPDASESVTIGKKKNRLTGELIDDKVENMLHQPLPYKIKWREKTKKVKQGSATIEMKPAKRTYRVEPYERKPVEAGLAKRMLSRAAGHGPGARGWVIASRQPTSFEPNGDWSLEEMRAWLFMVDGQANCGPSEQELRKKARSEMDADRLIQQEKITMLKRCFLRAANPKFELPSRSEFEKFIGRKDVQDFLNPVSPEAEKVLAHQEEKSENDASPVAKRRGRPRKKAD